MHEKRSWGRGTGNFRKFRSFWSGNRVESRGRSPPAEAAGHEIHRAVERAAEYSDAAFRKVLARK